MKTINFNGKRSAKEMNAMFKTIMNYLRGECSNPLSGMTERARQYFTWGARKFVGIESTDGYCYGIQFTVSGLKHRGRVRVWYNAGSDYFDVELLRSRKSRKDELVWSCNDLDCFQLHNVLHRHIERTDDPEV